MPTRILMVNLHSCQNAGDAALMLSATRQLRRHFPDCEIVLAMNDPASYHGELSAVGSLTSWLKQIDPNGHSRWRWWAFAWLPLAALLLVGARWAKGGLLGVVPGGRRALLQAYACADLVVSSPGGYLYSTVGFGLPLALAVYSMALALVAGKPLYLLPQSIGPLNRRLDRWLVGWLLKRARLVMLREAVSFEQLPLAEAERATVVQLPDMALIFKGASAAEGERWLAGRLAGGAAGGPRLGVTAINWGAQHSAFHNQDQYEQALAAAVRWFVEEQDGWVTFFPQVCGPTAADDDRLPARRVAARLAALGQRVVVINEPVEPDLLKAAYGRMDMFIGTRMHSNIFAVSQGVPTLAIGYQFKTRGIARVLGIEQWMFDIGSLEPNALIERLRDLWVNRAAVRAGLLHRLPGLERQAEQAGALITADFAALASARAQA